MMTSTREGSITVMIRHLRAGDREQVATLWGRYFDRLAALASPILRHRSNVADEADAALSAINSLCEGFARGKFDYVDGREVLWRTLAIITERKALQIVRRFRRQVSIEDDIAVIEATDEYQGIIRMTVVELMDALENPLWRQAALLHLEGYSVPEIAQKLGRGRECVYVWFRAIRKIWQEKAGGEWPLD